MSGLFFFPFFLVSTITSSANTPRVQAYFLPLRGATGCFSALFIVRGFADVVLGIKRHRLEHHAFLEESLGPACGLGIDLSLGLNARLGGMCRAIE